MHDQCANKTSKTDGRVDDLRLPTFYTQKDTQTDGGKADFSVPATNIHFAGHNHISTKYKFNQYKITSFRQWLCEKAASGLERILCRVLVKKNSRKA